jgi:hypothetical protein
LSDKAEIDDRLPHIRVSECGKDVWYNSYHHKGTTTLRRDTH